MGIVYKFSSLFGLFCFAISVHSQNRNDKEHNFVDMGLSVNWATCNIGSNNPEDYGDYFAWGETYTKSCYNKMTYRYSGANEDYLEALTDYTKYLGNRNKSNPNDIKLEDCDDVARVRLGGDWRMPTIKEINELVESCNWEFGNLNSIDGCWAISKINGNKIFFPLAGYISEGEYLDVGKSGKYWASELRVDMCFEAYQIWISFSDDLAEMNKKPSVFLSDDGYRENGRSVRAVCNK